MVDKPKGKTEILVEKFFDWCNRGRRTTKKRTSMQRRQIRIFKRRHPRIARTALVAVCTLAVGLVVVGFATPKTVTVNIDDSVEVTSTTYETTSMRVDSFIENHEIDYVYGQDIIDVELYKGITDGLEINIKKAVQIPVTSDGVTQTANTLPVTTEELLNKLNITVGENDIVEPAMDKTLYKGDKVVVKRVTFGEVVEEVDVDYATRNVPDYSMTIGKTAVVQQGTIGKERQTYNVTYIDGVESERELINSETLVEKKDSITSYGMYMNFSAPAGLQYKEKISNVRAVSYHFSGTPKGSYGKPCTYGTVAVDPSVIPLGSLLYIEGYGYAIANDTGSSIKGNVVDVYMEDIRQCNKWGARTVNVYVIS